MRVLRALVLAGSSLGLGTLAHDHAGAAATLGPGSIAAALVVLALSWVATARRVPWLLIAVILGVGQLLTHLALSAGHVGPAAHGASGGHAHHGATLTLPPVADHSDTRMFLMHAGASVVLTILFTVGEKALWQTVDRLLVTWAVPVLPLPQPRLVPAAVATPRDTLAHRRACGRAPPQCCAPGLV